MAHMSTDAGKDRCFFCFAANAEDFVGISVILVPQLHTHFPAVENIVTKINLQFLPTILSASGPLVNRGVEWWRIPLVHENCD